MRLAFIKLDNPSYYKILNIQVSKFSFAPYLKCLGTSSFESVNFYFQCLKAIFTQEQPIFHPLIEASICNKRNLAKDFSDSMPRKHVNVEINKLV